MLALLWGGAARAADPAPQTAKEHFVRGTQLYDLQRFDDAAKEYEAAYQVKSDPALLFNIGQAHRQAKNWELAEGAFRSYLRNVPRAANRARVEQMIVDIHLAATEQKKLADEQARKDAELKAEEAKRATAEAERQRAIAEAQARVEEARGHQPHADPAAAARGRRLKLIGIGLAAGGGALVISGGGLIGAAGSIASSLNNAKPETQFNPSDETRWRAERTAGIALLSIGGAVAIEGTAVAVIGARRQSEYMSARLPMDGNGATFVATGGQPAFDTRSAP